VITADEVDTLLFDVLGTVVDEAGSMRAELAAALDQVGEGQQAEALAADWNRRVAALESAIRDGAPWRSADDLNAEALEALGRLAGRFAIVALSNGNLSMLADMFAGGGLTWHCVLSGEMVRAYKPDPAVYRFAVNRLALDPRRTLMVAAHPWDLRAAATHRLRTAYIERAGEGTPEASDTFDLTSPDLAGLATRLLA
jgi:2-haloacid dehalogenase